MVQEAAVREAVSLMHDGQCVTVRLNHPLMVEGAHLLIISPFGNPPTHFSCKYMLGDCESLGKYGIKTDDPYDHTGYIPAALVAEARLAEMQLSKLYNQK